MKVCAIILGIVLAVGIVGFAATAAVFGMDTSKSFIMSFDNIDYIENVSDEFDSIKGEGNITGKIQNGEEKNFTFDSEINDIEINSVSADVRIICSSDNTVYVTYANNSGKTVKFSAVLKDRCLTIKERFPIALFSFGVSSAESTLDIELPEKLYNSLKINSTSGEITAENIECEELEVSTTSGETDLYIYAENMTINSTSGNCRIENCSDKKMKNLNLNSASGEITAENIECEELQVSTVSGNSELYVYADNINVNTTSGSCSLTNCTDKKMKNLNLSSISGDYIVSGMMPEKTIITGTSGDRDIKGLCGEVEISSTSGDFNIEFIEWNGDLRINSTSGDFEIKLPENSGAEIDFSAASGSVSVDLNGFSSTLQKGKTTVEGNNMHNIIINTTSGDYTISD